MNPEDAFGPGAFVRRWWPALVLGGTALGLLNFFYFWLDDVVREVGASPWPILVEELTAAYGTALLLPGILWAAFRWRLDRPGRLRVLPVHLLGVAAYSGLKTSWSWATRSALFPLLGWGPYDYGRMPARYLMELPSDLILYAVTLPAAYLVAHWRRSRDQQVAVSRLEARLAEARLSRLRAELHPHFLFNTLNAVSSVMYDDVEAADRMLTRLCDLLRRTMTTNETRQEVTLAEELEFLGIYLDLMRIRFGDRLTVRIEVPTELHDVRIPQLLLQPLVENALEHGVPAPPVPAQIEVRGEWTAEGMRITVADNGPGFDDPDGPEGGTGIGLANTRARLAELYGTAAVLRCESPSGGGARVVVDLPLLPLRSARPSAGKAVR